MFPKACRQLSGRLFSATFPAEQVILCVGHNVDKLHEVMLRIERFESGAFQAPAAAEKLIVEIFQACGHAVSQKGFAESDDGVDCFVRTDF